MASVWRDVVLLTIRETPSRSKEGSGFGVWVIQKLRDGQNYNVTVRSGSYYKHAVTGEKVFPKDGMTDWDFDALNKPVPNHPEKAPGKPTLFWDLAKPLLDRKNPPPVPTEEPAAPASPAGEKKPEPEPEMPPW